MSALVLAALLGCFGEKPDAEATGYVVSLVDTFQPRQLFLIFEEGTSEADAEAVIAATDSTVLNYTPSRRHYLIETPLGYSLQEIHDQLESDSRISVCMPNFLMYIDTWGTHILMAEDGSGQLYWFAGTGTDALQEVALEYIVRVRGFHRGEDPEGVPIVDVQSVWPLGERVVRKGGTITLIDRGSEGVVVILIDDDGDAWELLGELAEEIAGLPGIEGAEIAVDGCERHVSVTSRAGGREFRVTAYGPSSPGPG